MKAEEVYLVTASSSGSCFFKKIMKNAYLVFVERSKPHCTYMHIHTHANACCFHEASDRQGYSTKESLVTGVLAKHVWRDERRLEYESACWVKTVKQFRLVTGSGSSISSSSDVMRQSQQAVAGLWSSRLQGTGALCCLLLLIPVLTAASHHDHGKDHLHIARQTATLQPHLRACARVCVCAGAVLAVWQPPVPQELVARGKLDLAG